MLVDLYRLLPLEGVKILLVVFPSFVTGLEREERQTVTDRYSFGWRRPDPNRYLGFLPSWEGFLMLS